MAQTVRWALLGNAVSVHVARWLGERFCAPFTHKYLVGPCDRKLKPAAASVPGECTVPEVFCPCCPTPACQIERAHQGNREEDNVVHCQNASSPVYAVLQ